MITSNETDKILPALFELKKKLKPMSKDSKNPFFKSNYLELPDLLDNLEPLLIEVGIVLTQATVHRHDDEYVISRLSHASTGQWVEAEYKLGFKEDPQKFGACNTYGRRFSLKGLIGLSERDDDGNFASGKGNSSSKPANKPAKAPDKAPAKPASAGFGNSPAAKPADVEVAEKPVVPSARAGSFGG